MKTVISWVIVLYTVTLIIAHAVYAPQYFYVKNCWRVIYKKTDRAVLTTTNKNKCWRIAHSCAVIIGGNYVCR